MTGFWIIATIMIVGTLGMIAQVLLRQRRVAGLDRNEQNVLIAKERLRELQQDLQQGTITKAQFDDACKDLEQALLIDISNDNSPASVTSSVPGDRRTFIVLLFLIPALSLSLYNVLGDPSALSTNNVSANAALPSNHPEVNQPGKLPSIEDMVVKLEKRLEQQPNDSQGWFMLGRTYMTLGRFTEAARALDTLHKQVGDQPAVLLTYADALAMANDGRISGKPFELVQKALVISPNDPKALWLAGMGYEEQGQHETAVRLWKRLEPLLAGDDEALTQVRRLIQKAESKLGGKVAVAQVQTINQRPVIAGLTVMVSLDPALKDKVRPTDTVFVFARAIQGPPMPLAVVRKNASDLPLEVKLDDSMAMRPDMKLSSFSDVKVTARISRDGNAMPQSGDLSGEVSSVPVTSTSPVQVVINNQNP